MLPSTLWVSFFTSIAERIVQDSLDSLIKHGKGKKVKWIDFM